MQVILLLTSQSGVAAADVIWPDALSPRTREMNGSVGDLLQRFGFGACVSHVRPDRTISNIRHSTGPASTAKLMAPVSLACDSAGNIFIGDYNYIRKIDTSGIVSSLLFLRNPPHKVS